MDKPGANELTQLLEAWLPDSTRFIFFFNN
jgi:hypothetical protein